MKIAKYLSLTLIALVSCTGTSVDNNETTSSPKDLALQLYSVRDDIKKDYAGTIKKVSELGFTSIEAASYNDGKFYDRTPAEFKKDIEDAGMKVLSSHTTRQLTDKELATGNFNEAMQWWDICIQAHKEAGMEYLVAPWMAVPKTLKDLQTYCNYYNEIGKRCKENGILFGYHNHAHEFTKIEDIMMYDYMLENTNPEYVFFQMDVYWIVRGGQSPVEYFHKYKNRFALLHFKDHKELGQSGMVGFDAILKNASVAGVKHLVVEVEKYNFEPIESIKQSINYLQRCPLVQDTYNK